MKIIKQKTLKLRPQAARHDSTPTPRDGSRRTRFDFDNTRRRCGCRNQHQGTLNQRFDLANIECGFVILVPIFYSSSSREGLVATDTLKRCKNKVQSCRQILPKLSSATNLQVSGLPDNEVSSPALD